MSGFTVEDYREYLLRCGVNPDEKHVVCVEVSELELNALEDLLYTELTNEEREVLEEIVKELWRKLVSEADRN